MPGSNNAAMVILASRPLARSSRSDPRIVKAAVDRRLAELLPLAGPGDELAAAMRYALLTPGKRVRPILTILTAWEVGPEDLRALDAGCALEMIHAASLILDDMPAMDDANERRGQMATHVKYGEDVAMLCAISLLSHAFATVSAMPGVDSVTRCSLVAILARAVGVEGLAGGQYRDLRSTFRDDSRAVEEANRRKTGTLFMAAADCVTALLQIDGKTADVLRGCADKLGQAYQLFDDMLDGTRSPGNEHCEDHGKTTVLSLRGYDEARRTLTDHLDDALAGLRPDGALSVYIRSLFSSDHILAEAAR